MTDSKKKGRPTNCPKGIRMEIRLDNDTYNKLNIIVKEKNSTRSEVVRASICKEYDDLKK